MDRNSALLHFRNVSSVDAAQPTRDAAIDDSMTKKTSEFELIVPKSDAAWSAIQNQYGSRITVAEIDHLFARFVLGLTTPFYAERDPELHLRACEVLIGRQLPPERSHAALHAVPDASEAWVAKAYDLAEGHGTKIGTTLAEQRSRIGPTEAGAGAAQHDSARMAGEQGG